MKPLHIYKAPRVTPAPRAGRGSECPFCHRVGWRPPKACAACGVSGYPNGTPPGFWRGSKAAQISDDVLDMDQDHDDPLDLDYELDQEAA